ncbi:MAG: hypothetical protein Salg2KO_05690 [Salibacteraceae bacterium]
MEREDAHGNAFALDNVFHHPVISGSGLLDKLKDKNRVTRLLKHLNDEVEFDLIIARTSLAARLVADFAKRLNILLVVESFEPHADYMVEDGVWKKNGLKYKIARRAEVDQIKNARFIFTVSNAYASMLRERFPNNKEKISTIPCCVDANSFAFSSLDRDQIRSQLGYSEHCVAIYTGKLGGIYLDREALDLLKQCQDYFGKDQFRLIVLTPQKDLWRSRLLEMGFTQNEFYIDLVPLNEVPKYLSAADFALSLHRPTPSKIAITPIKNAEYLANGLPIVSPQGIGDDSEALKVNELGVLLDNNLELSANDFEQLDVLIKNTRIDNRCRKWVETNRSFDIVRSNYEMVLNSIAS